MSELQDLVERLDPNELEVMRERIEARLQSLSRLPERVVERLLNRNIRTAVANADGVYTGQVVYCDENVAVLQTDSRSATVHHFDEPVIPTPRGEYLELRRIDGRYEVGRDGGQRWKWLELDRDEALAVLSRIGVAAELGIRQPGPEHLSIMVPQTHDATYRGKILGVTPHHVLQHVGRAGIVAHCGKDFPRAPERNTDVSVRYHFGRVKSLKSRDRGLEQEGRGE